MRARRARKCARTQNFFIIQKYYKKSLCNFFLLLISQKLTILAQFEFCWKIKNSQNRSKSTKMTEKTCILVHFEDFVYFSKVQIELKSSIFEILTKEKIAQRFFIVFLDDKKISGARARTSTLHENAKNSNFLACGQNILRVRARQNFFRNRKVE